MGKILFFDARGLCLSAPKPSRTALALEIAKRTVFIFFAIFALFNPKAGLITFAIVFGLDLLIVHVIKLVSDVRVVGPQKRLRETNVSFDALAITVGIILIIFPALLVKVLAVPILIGLFIFGATRIANGGFSAGLSRGHRTLLITTGIILICLGILAIAFPKIIFNILAYVMAFVFLMLGIESLILGLTSKVPQSTKPPAPTTLVMNFVQTSLWKFHVAPTFLE